MDETAIPWSEKQQEYFTTFRDNLNKGIEYYKDLFSKVKHSIQVKKSKWMSDLEHFEDQLKKLPIRDKEEVVA